MEPIGQAEGDSFMRFEHLADSAHADPLVGDSGGAVGGVPPDVGSRPISLPNEFV